MFLGVALFDFVEFCNLNSYVRFNFINVILLCCVLYYYNIYNSKWVLASLDCVMVVYSNILCISVLTIYYFMYFTLLNINLEILACLIGATYSQFYKQTFLSYIIYSKCTTSYTSLFTHYYDRSYYEISCIVSGQFNVVHFL